jgi:hypothetical protein
MTLSATVWAQAPPPADRCETQRSACRAACFDRHATKDAAAFGACKVECDKAWLACTRGGK